MIDRDFTALQSVAEDSALWRAACAIGTGLQRSWSHSRTAGTLTRMAASISAMPIVMRIRVSAMAMAWAAAGYGASLFIAPPYVRSGIPRAAIFATAAVALVVSIGADGFANAWAHSSLRAALRR